MSRHVILDSASHLNLRVRTEASAELGDGIMTCLAVPAEFRRLATEFPIVFRHDPETDSFSAVALFGFEAGENLFLEEGQWDASRKPLALAIQPFLVGRPQGDGLVQVHIDLDHPRVSTDDDGVRLFDDQGQPSPFVEEIATMLAALDEGYRESADFFAALDRYELFEPFSMDVTMDDGGQHRLVGYHLINEDKLNLLEPGALAELHSAGYLLPAFMAIASLGNLSKLVQRKNRRSHA